MLSVLLVVVAALGVAGCLPAPPAWVGSSGPGVLVVGDSLVNGAQTGGGLDSSDPDRFLDEALNSAGYRASVSKMIGASTGDLVMAKPLPSPAPDVVVVALGTNDMHDGAVPVATAVGNIEAYLDEAGAVCSVVVTIVDEPSWGLDVTAPLFNAALVGLAESRPGVLVADWAAVVDGHPEFLGSDGVHHTVEGQAAYRALIVDAADRCTR